MAVSDKPPTKSVAVNRKALHEYFVVERREAGIELHGTEVKSIRDNQVSLAGGFARIEDGQVFLHNVSISPYEFGNRFNHEPNRVRRLLLHRREIEKLRVQTEQRGHTLIPLSLYFKRGLAKIELGLCKGKRQSDRRETLRRKTVERETARDMAAGHRRGKRA